MLVYVETMCFIFVCPVFDPHSLIHFGRRMNRLLLSYCVFSEKNATLSLCFHPDSPYHIYSQGC